MKNMNLGVTAIVPFTYFNRTQKVTGSSFLRADGLVANTPDFKIWHHGQKYDNLIFQKAYWIEMMQLFEGPKILDLCDPDWINGGVDIVAVSKLVDAVTCSSPALTELVKKMLPRKPVFHVPDRLNFNIFPPPREAHQEKAKKVVWFGYVNNAQETLEQLLPAIARHQLQLTIIADKPYAKEDGIKKYGVQCIKYDQSTAYSLIRQADLVLNPKSDKAFFKYKSNNKTIISWKLGVPVAATNEEIDLFIDPAARNKEVADKQLLVAEEYDIRKSANEYRNILSQIRETAGCNIS